MTHGIDTVLSWPIFKWIVGSMAALVASMGALLWKKQTKTISKLEDDVTKLVKDSSKFVSHEHLEDFRREFREEIRGMNDKLLTHNNTVTGRLDQIIVEVMRLTVKKEDKE